MVTQARRQNIADEAYLEDLQTPFEFRIDNAKSAVRRYKRAEESSSNESEAFTQIEKARCVALFVYNWRNIESTCEELANTVIVLQGEGKSQLAGRAQSILDDMKTAKGALRRSAPIDLLASAGMWFGDTTQLNTGLRWRL
jgi:hypothetical protein